ncbi:MAG: hypothetical protein AABZ60_02950 [Planctomycetota bacterium]
MSLEKLHELQQELGAHFQEGRVAHYGSVLEEIASLGKQSLLFDSSDLGTLLVQGVDRISFINRLITVDLNSLSQGSWRKGLWVNGKGRFEYRFQFYLRADDLIMATQQEAISKFLQKLEMYHFSEKVSFSSANWRVFYLQGPGSRAILEKIFQHSPSTQQFIQVGNVLIAFYPQYQMEEGFELLVPESELKEVFYRLIQASAKPVGEEARKRFRIQSLEPEVGYELTSDLIPLEIASLKPWISFEKGCFPGQEVLARMHNLGHPGKILVQFSLPPLLVPEKSILFHEGNAEAGVITSVSSYSPSIALGFLRWKFREQRSSFFIETAQGKIPVERIF